MNARDELREAGSDLRRRLGLAEEPGATLAPGFGDLLDEIVFGRVWGRPGLGLEDRMVATLSALTSVQALPQLGLYVGSAIHIGLSPRLVQEVMIHCAMYGGMPTAQNSLAVVADVLESRGMAAPSDDPPRSDLEALTEAGRATMNELHAERSEAGYASPESAAAGLYNTAIQFLYGDIWNRPGITRRQRMICSVAAFTSQRMEAQQRKFFQSARNVGLTREEILEVIVQTGPYSGFPPALNALAIADDVLD